MNTLFSSGQNVAIALGEAYTVKDDEVFINHHPYKKRDLEIQMTTNPTETDPLKVKVGIRLRDGVRSLPADMMNYEKWKIDGTTQTSLAELVENINTSLQ